MVVDVAVSDKRVSMRNERFFGSKTCCIVVRVNVSMDEIVSKKEFQ